MSRPGEPPSVALVGVGGVCTAFHIPALKASRARVVAAADPSPDALARAKNAFPHIRTVASPSELPKEVDCAVVSSPTTMHAAQAVELLERGIHVLCEKPLACTLGDATTVARTAEKQSRVLQVGYFRRFHPSAQWMRTTVARGDRGPPKGCTMVVGHVWRSGELSPSTMRLELSGGGVLIDIGVHLLDWVCDWFQDVSLAESLDDNRGGMEANALIRLDGGVGATRVPITLILSRTRELGWKTAVEFGDGFAVVDFNEGHAVTWMSEARDAALPSLGRRTVLRLAPPRNTTAYFVAQWREFLSRLGGGSEERSSVKAAIHVTELVEACYRRRAPLRLPWESDAEEALP